MILRNFFLLFQLLASVAAMAQRQSSLDWSTFLSRNDLVYDTLRAEWSDGLFTGNGMLGTMLYMNDSNSLRIELGRVDVVDHRGDSISPLYAKARLPIGHFVVSLRGRILKNSGRLDLWNAEARGTIITSAGSMQWRMLTLSQTDIIIFETTTTGSESPSLAFLPEKSVSSRIQFSKDIPPGYGANPAFEWSEENNTRSCRQPMLAGGDYTTAWTNRGDARHQISFISVGIDNNHSSAEKVKELVRKSAAANFHDLVVAHRNWWHQYYPESFVSVPDARLESFYWLQQYKMASATRAGNLPIDLMGPWYRYTPWPAYWFNLNIELSYSPMYTANRLSLAEGLVKMLNSAKSELHDNVPPAYRQEAMALGRFGGVDMNSPVKVMRQRDSLATNADLELGNLTWVLHSYWLHYRYTMNPSLKDSLVFLLKQSINYYLALLYKEDDDKWHLPYSYSPEYPNGVTRDCNYDLSLLRWGCQTLLQLAPKDQLGGRWQDVLDKLVSYPQDENGLRIGRDLGFGQSHRHFSHLLMIYPLYLLNWDQPESHDLITKSLNHWHSFKTALQGYSFTGGASIYAMMGEGDKALGYLNQLCDRYIKNNTMYLESGPVIETPLAAAASIQEMLLQSWGGKIRVFPAAPQRWKDVAFSNLRAQGAFLISASRKNGETRWIRIKSLAGEPCIIRTDMKGFRTIGSASLTKTGEGEYKIDLKRNEEFVLYSRDPNEKIPPVASNSDYPVNYWGLKKTAMK